MEKIFIHISELTPRPDNPRTVGQRKFNKLRESIEGFPEMMDVRPIVVNMGHEILAGNAKYYALQEMGKTMIEVVRVDWPEEKQREFIIKDNLHAGEWDYDILANQWDDLPTYDWGVPGMRNQKWANDSYLGFSKDKDLWGEKPEIADSNEPQKPKFEIRVSFSNASDRDRLAQKLKLEGYNVKIYGQQ